MLYLWSIHAVSIAPPNRVISDASSTSPKSRTAEGDADVDLITHDLIFLKNRSIFELPDLLCPLGSLSRLPLLTSGSAEEETSSFGDDLFLKALSSKKEVMPGWCPKADLFFCNALEWTFVFAGDEKSADGCSFLASISGSCIGPTGPLASIAGEPVRPRFAVDESGNSDKKACVNRLSLLNVVLFLNES